MAEGHYTPPMRFVGRCELFAEIDSGGMATVHLGRLGGAGGFAKIVAIKRMHAQFAKDPQFVAMFLDEARLVARIEHPNVLKTLDLIEEKGELFIVMEYVPGATLQQLVSKTARNNAGVPMKMALSMICGMLHGLHAAHEATTPTGEPLELVHRDVSPENILIGSDGVARLLDFGMARAMGKLHVTQVGQVKGKLSVMAPEQVQGKPVSRHTDVFASGVVLWQTLTGERLIKGEHMSEIAHNVIHQQFLPPSEMVPELPKKLDSIVMRALERDPDKRWQSAEKMAMALEAVGDLATRRQVGQWVEKIAWQKLAERAQAVANIEATPAGLEVSNAMPPRAGSIPSEDSVGPVANSARISRGRLGSGARGLADTARRLFDDARDSVRKALSRDAHGQLRLPTAVGRIVTVRPRITIAVALSLTAFAVVLVLSLGGTSDETASAPAASGKTKARISSVAASSSAAVPTKPAEPSATDFIEVPAGAFTMGCNTFADRLCANDEMPARHVGLRAFKIDRTEVTVTQYGACIAEGACDDANLTSDGIDSRKINESDKCNFARDGREDHPINCVSHAQAASYCKWVGGRLPTEAEWERTAGGSDAWPYPSGEPSISCKAAVMSERGDGCGRGTSWPVGSKKGGASPRGALDMAGNVAEWVADWYDPGYYRHGEGQDPPGPSEGVVRAVRGGSWRSPSPRLLRTSARDKRTPDTRSMTIGFRCVRSD
jgi:formylglycine-generating enzyme required for sulfatase activity/serine/threonine protein kinase